MTNQTQAGDRPYPNRTEKLPWRRDEITPEWMTRLLQNRYPGVVVNNIELLQLFDSHTTKMRIALDLNDAGRAAGIPRQVCLKSNYSGAFADVDICELEARFYHFLRDEMTVPTPVCYYADWDDDGKGHGLIILEDLTELGGTFGHSTQHTGVDGVASALKGLAQLHGDLWNSPILDQHAWLPKSMNTPIDNDQIRIMWEYIQINLADPKFRAVLPQALLDDPTRLQKAFDALADWENSLSDPYCLNLGDCHLGNTYLKKDGERMWLDWQLVRKGRPFRDLTYFMVGSLTIEERRANEIALIKHYREALLATGVQGVPSFDDFFASYRRWIIYGMQAWVANMDHWGQSGLPMNERFFTAGEDLDTWKLLLG
ncbi:MAG: aminoglycoside phosphotransferase [Verrucomicrobiaceae bacterium]|nr:aminoglycoside phosphotransferase [Verrucomicrobiaceae bacterium]